MKKLIIFAALTSLLSFKSFSNEVQSGATDYSVVSKTDVPKCILKSNIYYLEDKGDQVILPLGAAKSRTDCDKKMDYSQIEDTYNKLKKVKCDVYSESKNGGCKKTVGYINAVYKDYSDIISSCDYFSKNEQFVKYTGTIEDSVKAESNSSCPDDFKHARYNFRINQPDFKCLKLLPSKAKCITKNNKVLERVIEFGNGWKIDGVIWSENQGSVSDPSEAQKKCESIGGKLPNYNDFQLASSLREVILIKNGWLNEPYSGRDFFDKYPDKRDKTLSMMKRSRKVEVKKDKYDVYCIKKS